MKRILILYFSGVGATKRVAELMHAQLRQNCNVDMVSFESNNVLNISRYDAVIIGTPVYHGAPAKGAIKYWDAAPRLNRGIPAFIYNTRGLRSLNTNRILSKVLCRKNILTIMDREYRSPASDGTLVAPFIKRFFEYEFELEKTVDRDCVEFLDLLKKDEIQSYIPRFRFGSIVNAPNKLAGQLITLKIHLHKDKCVKCGLCIKQCPHTAFLTDNDGYPKFDSKNCENCYRCIHHCPKAALSLSKRRTPKRQLR